MSAEVGTNRYEQVKAVPSLEFVFTGLKKSMTDRISGKDLITFTRTTVGTYVDENGVIQTADINEPRFDYDPETGEDLGLLIEEQKTNLLRYSDQFDNETVWTQSNTEVTANQVISPDGTQTADLVEQLIAGVNDGVNQLVTGLTANAQYTFSIWARSNSPITIKIRIWSSNNSVTCNLTSEWKRFYVTETIPATNVYALAQALQPGEQFYVWGAQLEEGSFATSYIPTDGTPGGIVRGADVASITGTNFSSWYNQSEGSFYFKGGPEFTIPSPNNNFLLTFSGSNINFDEMSLYQNFFFESVIRTRKAGVFGPGAAISPVGVGVSDNAIGYSNEPSVSYSRNNNFQTGTNVNQISTSLIKLELGAKNGTNYLNGHISRFTYWPVRLADTYLQELTQ